MPAAAASLPSLLKVFGDPTRLRMLALLEGHELRVGELSEALGTSQSRVSNHLRLLREHGLLVERHAGTATFLRSALSLDPGTPPDYPGRLWLTLREGLGDVPQIEADRQRLVTVLAARQVDESFFDRLAGEWNKLGVQFQSGQARQRAAVGLLPRGLVLADLGCGTGYMGASLLPFARKLYCVDRSEAMLTEAAARLSPSAGGVELSYLQSELDELPIESGELDGLVCGMVLHHLEHPAAALTEMRRVLRPGGRAVLLELAPHSVQWMHQSQGDRHLGLDPEDLVTAMHRAGFEDVQLEAVDDRYCPTPPEGEDPVQLSLFIVRGHVPARESS